MSILLVLDTFNRIRYISLVFLLVFLDFEQVFVCWNAHMVQIKEIKTLSFDLRKMFSLKKKRKKYLTFFCFFFPVEIKAKKEVKEKDLKYATF